MNDYEIEQRRLDVELAASDRTDLLVRALENAPICGGLPSVLDEAVEFHPPEVIEALLRCVLQREGVAAVYCAALLTYLHHHAREPFDESQRAFFLRFNTPSPVERVAAFYELCARIDVDAEMYLART